MEILTDIVLRAHWFKTHDHVYVTDKHTLLTPAAKDFIKEHHIQLVYADSGGCDLPAGSVISQLFVGRIISLQVTVRRCQ